MGPLDAAEQHPLAVSGSDEQPGPAEPCLSFFGGFFFLLHPTAAAPTPEADDPSQSGASAMGFPDRQLGIGPPCGRSPSWYPFSGSASEQQLGIGPLCGRSPSWYPAAADG